LFSGEILLAGAAMTILAIAMSYILGWANKAFHVETDPRIEAAENILPGANCGGCGYVGCREYAEAIVEGEELTKCTVGGTSVAQALGQLMEVEVEDTWPYRAVVHCSAKLEERLGRSRYHGVQSCAAANMISGIQSCTFGCLGLGDCVDACDYDAIHIVDGVAVVDYEKCTGCGACTQACPRNIITMVPFKQERMMVVTCSNKDKGKDVSAVCTIGCIGCGACARVNDLIQIEDGLATIDYDRYPPGDVDFAAAVGKCPRASLVWIGRPSEKDLTAVADEEVPERIEADFKTTMDNTEWRS
jgi:Na+-translocating ferredoxin:NAD+ oxidoreductase subunit B